MRSYVFNHSLLIMRTIELQQTSHGAHKVRTVAIHAPDNKQSLLHTEIPSALVGVQPGTDEGDTGPAENFESSTPSYIMCQPELGVQGCPQAARACHTGVAVPHAVEYALSLCGGEMVYLTVRRVRDVERFPWDLPAGWYALHDAPHQLLEPLQLKFDDTVISIPAILATGCIVAVIRLGNPRPCKDFDGAQWALGQWCQAIEDVLMLRSCVASPMDYLRRLWILPEEIRSQVLASSPSSRGKTVSDDTNNVVDMHVLPHMQAMIVNPGDFQRVCTSLRSSAGLCPALATVHSAQGRETGMCKLPRLQSFLHASFPSVPPSHVDRLQKLYPHPRDNACNADGKGTHVLCAW